MLLICIFAYVLAAPPLLSCAAWRHRIHLFDELTQFTGHLCHYYAIAMTWLLPCNCC